MQIAKACRKTHVNGNQTRPVCVKAHVQFLQRYVGTQWSSEKEHKVDALALRADERRDKLRKATGRCK